MISQVRVVFMGSPEFAVPTLEALAKFYSVIGVVAQPDRPAGRGQTLVQPAAKSAALHLGIPVLQPEKLRLPEAMYQLRTWAPDLIVVAAFGQILHSEVLDLPQFGCINVHGSLLPRWRGAAPAQAAILAGDAEAGVTIMKMDSGVDTGPMLNQQSIPIAPDDTAGTLLEKLAPLGADLLIETLPLYLSNELQLKPQPEGGATSTKMLKKEDGLLDFDQPAIALERRVRAFTPWPGVYFQYYGNPLKIRRASTAIGKYEPGERVIHQGIPAIGTSDGLLVLEEVQPAGKRNMPGKAFLAGARGWVITNSPHSFNI